MKIKESEQLQALAAVSGKTAKQVSDIIVSELVKKSIISDSSENWGYPVIDCLKRDIKISELTEIMHAIGIPNVTSRNFDALCECVLMGEDDCPECGGKMEITDFECRTTGGDGYLTPYEYTPVWEQRTCIHCGYMVDDEPSY